MSEGTHLPLPILLTGRISQESPAAANHINTYLLSVPSPSSGATCGVWELQPAQCCPALLPYQLLKGGRDTPTQMSC